MNEINEDLKEMYNNVLKRGKDFGIFGDLNIKIQDDKVVVGSKFDMGDVINELVIVALIKFLDYNEDMKKIDIANLFLKLQLFNDIVRDNIDREELLKNYE